VNPTSSIGFAYATRRPFERPLIISWR